MPEPSGHARRAAPLRRAPAPRGGAAPRPQRVSRACRARAHLRAGSVQAGDSLTGRFTRPEEVADLVVFLAGDRAANITGSDFAIDGGLVSTL